MAGEVPEDPINSVSFLISCREGPGKFKKGLNPGGRLCVADHTSEEH